MIKDSWEKSKSKRDLVHLVEIAHGCLACNGVDGLTGLLYKLKAIAGFAAVTCSCLEPARLAASAYKIIRAVVHPFGRNDPYATVEWCYRFDGSIRDILLSLNLQVRLNELDRKGDGRLNICIEVVAKGRLMNGRIFGAYEASCNRWIMLVFASRNGFKDPGGSIVIEISAPHLIHAFKGLKPFCAAREFNLTRREYEIKKKLDAVNRTRAMAIAVGSGLIYI